MVSTAPGNKNKGADDLVNLDDVNVLSLSQLTDGEVTAASCTDYAKGEYGPESITSDPICEQACQTAEGLPVGRFKSEGEDYKKCTCLKIEENGSASETRALCQDETPSGAERVVAGMGLALATATMLVAFAFM